MVWVKWLWAENDQLPINYHKNVSKQVTEFIINYSKRKLN